MDVNAIKLIEQIKKEEDYFQKAKLIAYLNREKQIPIKKLSEYLSLKPSYICHILRLNNLPEIIIDGYYSKMITLSHLFIISRLKEEAAMINLYEQVLTDSLTVIQTEHFVREALYNIKTEGERLSAEERQDLESCINKISQKIHCRVIQSRIRSKVEIKIKGSLSETSEVLRLLIQRLK